MRKRKLFTVKAEDEDGDRAVHARDDDGVSSPLAIGVSSWPQTPSKTGNCAVDAPTHSCSQRPIPESYVFRCPKDSGRWRERYARFCVACDSAGVHCSHFAELPLRLLLVGHNPSTHAYSTGFAYSNPSNLMFSIVRDAGLFECLFEDGSVPRVTEPADFVPLQNLSPAFGIGWTDVGVAVGSDAGRYSRRTMLAWREDFFARITAHVARARRDVARILASSSAAKEETEEEEEEKELDLCNFAPTVVAFTGKRQFQQLFDTTSEVSPLGFGKTSLRPASWPACLERSEVWIMPSTSGRAAMTRAARVGPYKELAARIAGIERFPVQAELGSPSDADIGVLAARAAAGSSRVDRAYADAVRAALTLRRHRLAR